MRRLVFLLAALAAVALAPQAGAQTVQARDDQGRRITFDVRARGVDVGFYREILSNAAHGDEITRVRVRIVWASEVGEHCRTVHAAGCYYRNLIVVPAGRDARVAHTLLHEYGHHLDAWRGVAGVGEPNGTSHWWAARGMERLERQGRVVRDYSRGWSHSIAEIFAEDYAYLNLDLPYEIRWLSPPGPVVRAALRRDVPGLPRVSQPPPPLLITRSGSLAPGAEEVVRFGLLGPGRRATFTVRAAGDVRLVLDCAGRRVERSGRTVTIDERDLGPDFHCRATVASASQAQVRYTLRLRLVVTKQSSASTPLAS